MSLWTAPEIIAATGGEASADFAVTGVAFDSREIGPGDLFVAMKGEAMDGHRFVEQAFAAGRYDFHMGRKLREHLERAGFRVTRTLAIGDGELSFRGPARPGVIDSWRRRIDGMKLLRDYCGTSFDEVREEFLGCLSHPDHTCSAKVCACIAHKT